LFAAGLALAIWARIYLGRNWGMPMTEKREPALVTSGPYRFVIRSPSHLLGHPARLRGHGTGDQHLLVAPFRRVPGLNRLLRARRGGDHDQLVPERVSELSGADEGADPHSCCDLSVSRCCPATRRSSGTSDGLSDTASEQPRLGVGHQLEPKGAPPAPGLRTRGLVPNPAQANRRSMSTASGASRS